MLDDHMKYIAADKQRATNIPGIFAAGDVWGPPWQMAKAVGEGCVAGLSAAKYAKQKQWFQHTTSVKQINDAWCFYQNGCRASSSRNNDVPYEYDNVCTPCQQGHDIVPMVGCCPKPKGCRIELNHQTLIFLHLGIIYNFQLFHWHILEQTLIFLRKTRSTISAHISRQGDMRTFVHMYGSYE